LFEVLSLLILARYIDQKTAKGPFRSSSQAATCYYQSNHVKCLAQGHKKRTSRHIFTFPLMLKVKQGSSEY